MKQRFSKAAVIADLFKRMEGAMWQYKKLTGRDYDAGNGYSQVPKGNEQAFLHYGRIIQCQYILDDLL